MNAKTFQELQLYQEFEDEMIDGVTHKKWITTDKSIQWKLLSTEDFIEFHFISFKVKKHSFIAKQQKKFYNYKKENLKRLEILITCYFNTEAIIIH